MGTKDIGSCAFGYFAALVEKQRFIEAPLLGALQSPDVEDPRGNFRPGKGRCRVTAMLAKTQANRFAVRGKTSSAEQQVHFRQILAALPESDLIVDSINSCRAFAHVVPLNQLAQTGAHCGGIEGKGHAGASRVFLEPLPVPLECKGLTAKNTQGGEEPATVEQPRLARRKARLLDGHDVPVEIGRASCRERVWIWLVAVAVSEEAR